MVGLLAKRRLKNLLLFIPNMLLLCFRLLTDARVPAAERALDAILADSFPASDPPPWTLGVSLSRKD